MSEEGIVQAVFGRSMADLMALNPEIKAVMRRNKPLTYEEFVEQINLDLENIITSTESGKQLHLSKSEDELTEHLIGKLKENYSSVHHDPQNGGHCDIYMETKSADGVMFRWITEAKIWKGFDYVYGGLDSQLLRSYANGGIHNNRGGLIFYSKLSSGGTFAMKQWHDGLKDKGITIEDRRSDKLRFTTNHQLNERQGADYSVRHYMIDVYHEPTQKALDKAKAKARDELKAKLRKELEDEIREQVRNEIEEEMKKKSS